MPPWRRTFADSNWQYGEQAGAAPMAAKAAAAVVSKYFLADGAQAVRAQSVVPDGLSGGSRGP